ncbi:ATPase [soil metagenome]
MDNYQLLISKLDAFIRKYYKNQLIRGGIYAFTLGLAFYLVVTMLESAGHFNTAMRTVLFYSFFAGILFIIWRFVTIPLFHLYRIGKIISHEQAANIVGAHFTEVKDKLLNVLQLKEQAEESLQSTVNGQQLAAEERQQSTVNSQQLAAEGNREFAVGNWQMNSRQPSSGNSELLLASINQKAAELKPVPFVGAVNFSENKKYLRYAAIPFLILVVVLFTAPSLIKDSTKRLMDHTTYFEKPAPFSFELQNKSLKTIQQQDFTLDVKIKGQEVPLEAFIEIDGNQFKLEKENLTTFHYTFKNIQKNTDFKFFADGFYSREYSLEALPNPVLMNFEIALDYPAYLKKPSEKLQNTGDLLIPAGTKATWRFHTRNTESLKLSFEDTIISPQESGDNLFAFTKRFTKNDSYSVQAANHFMQSNDSVRYAISVIPDLYPSISVEQQQDSFSTKRLYFKGLIKDDYGFTKLTFNYHFLKSGDSTQSNKGKQFSENLSVNRNSTTDQFFHFWDVTDINVIAGDEIEYYFEVSDNDGINGAKSTRSQSQVFKAPTLKEIAENSSKNNDNLKSDLKESIAAAKQLQKDMTDLNNKLMDKKEMAWDDKKKANELLNKQMDLQRKLEELKNKNQRNNEEKSEYKPVDQSLLDKQKQLQDLLEKMMTPEMKKMLEELQKMMEQANKEDVQDQLKQMKMDNKDMEKEMERALELFKQLEFQQKMQDNIDKLNDLAKKQDDLSKQSEDKNSDSKDLKDKQDDLNKQFDDFKKDMDDLEKKNEALEEKNNMEKTDQQEESISQDQKESSEQLAGDKKGKAGKSQKSAAQKMDQLAKKMEQMQSSMEAEQQEEDMDALRALLENLLHLSFDQEKLMGDLATMDVNNPQYLKASQQQRKLKDDAKMIEDSLFALSKRVVAIAGKVNQEISSINMNMDESLDNLEDRMVPQARSRQQFAMTSINNLTLMLSEALQQMQQQSQQSKPGQGSCKKPGGAGKKPSLSEMKKMQDELNKNMKKAKEAMEKGGKTPGKKGKPGEGIGMSEQLAKMAAQQQFIRDQLQKFNLDQNKDGRNSLGNLQEIQQQMEETENDIVNRNITEQTLNRQQEILTRLLESERAERERDQDEQRKSEEAKNYQKRNPPAFEEYKKLKLKEMELLRTVPPELNSYYKQKVNDYFQAIENQ